MKQTQHIIFAMLLVPNLLVSQEHDLSEDTVIYKDFNFDGQKDIALKDSSHQSCYGGTAYRIYLKKETMFVWNEAFSKLTYAKSCGMFKVDHSHKQLITTFKSGCCQHSTTYYRIDDDRPLPIKVIKEVHDPITNKTTTTIQNTINTKEGGQ